jgi:small-conductance mechanosensitive channel
MKQTTAQQIMELERKLQESENKAKDLKLSANDTAKKIVELERKLREETENKTEDDEKIRVSIQNQQITIFCLILLSLIGTFSFIAMLCITKKSLVENKKE